MARFEIVRDDSIGWLSDQQLTPSGNVCLNKRAADELRSLLLREFPDEPTLDPDEVRRAIAMFNCEDRPLAPITEVVVQAAEAWLKEHG